MVRSASEGWARSYCFAGRSCCAASARSISCRMCLALRQSSITTGRSLLCASLITLPEKEWLMYDVRTTTRRVVARTAGSRSSLPFVAIQTLLGSHVCRFRDSVSCPPATKTRSVMERTVYCTSCLLYTSDAADDLLCVDLG